MKSLGLAVLFSLVAAAPGRADVTYSITLTDEENATLVQRTDEANTFRRTQPTKGKPPADKTPTQYLTDYVKTSIGHWETAQAEDATRKDDADRTPRQKALVCRRAKLKNCP